MIECKVRCYDGYSLTVVYPKRIPKGGEVWVTEDVAKKMMESQSGVAVIERRLIVNKRRKKDAEET